MISQTTSSSSSSHFSALRNSCVRVLKLCDCNLILLGNLSAMQFASIQSVYLDQVFLTDKVVSDLNSGYSNLETLVLVSCYGMQNLKICSSKLKILSLWNFYSQNEVESLEICTPNLHSISIVCFEMGRYSFKQTPTLVQAHVDFMDEERHYKYWKVARPFSGVKHFVVENWWFKLLASEDVVSKNSVLKNLNFLELRAAHTKSDLLGVAALLECSPNLHTLVVDVFFKMEDDEIVPKEHINKPIKFRLPSLKLFKMKHFTRTKYQ